VADHVRNVTGALGRNPHLREPATELGRRHLFGLDSMLQGVRQIGGHAFRSDERRAQERDPLGSDRAAGHKPERRLRDVEHRHHRQASSARNRQR
jgi:hypothetical protein